MEKSSESGVERRRALEQAEELIDRLHAEAETHRKSLARAIHDDLGGLLVSAAMDFTSVQQHLSEPDFAILELLERGTQTLRSAIDLSRRMVEELRPTILDNIGLFAALKWQLKQASEGSGARLTESFPPTEPSFQPNALTALFRVAEEAIGMMFKRGGVMAADINLQIEDDAITMQFFDDGVPVMAEGVEVGSASALTSMQHRIRALGGTVELLRTDSGGTLLRAHMPLRTSGPQDDA